MPSVRRSNRIQGRKNNQINKCSRKSETPISTKEVKPQTVVKSKFPKLCSGCKSTHPPIKRYNIVEWVQCDNCDSWWHAECACINVEDIIKLDLYDITYTCVLCVLRGSPWITENCTLPNLINKEDPDQNTHTEDSQSFSPVEKYPSVQLIKKEDSVNNNCQESICDQKPKLNNSHIIIVDNIKGAQDFKSSKVIQESLKQHSEFKEVEFAYSLPRGGVAIHFNSNKKAEEVLSNWPKKVFSDSDSPHKIENKASTSTGFIKNIDIRLTDSQLKLFLESKECKVKEVKKVFHRHSGRPMPVRKVQFHSVFDLEKATKLEYTFKLNGKPAFCEKEKGFRVVRCFSCHRYNHISANCPNRSNCENCGSEDHTFTGECYRQSNCINCGGKHKSSSNSCPKYLEIIQRIQKNQMF